MCQVHDFLHLLDKHLTPTVGRDDDLAWLDLLTSLSMENASAGSPPPQGCWPALREVGDTKLLSSGAQLFPQENSPAAGTAQSAYYRGSLPGKRSPFCIFMNSPELPGRVG